MAIGMKVIFIINSISAQRCIKRVEEFIAHGYEVEVYGFSRKMEIHARPEHFSLNVLGEFDNSLPLWRRFPILIAGVRNVLQKHKNDKNSFFYLFQLDIALAFKILNRRNFYVFEESDLMHTYIENRTLRTLLEFVDKKIIKDSLLSVFTSEGFLRFHYGNRKYSNNCLIITNRLNPLIRKLKQLPYNGLMNGKLRIGFVGFLRYKSILSFVKIFCRRFPNYEFHFYGEHTSHYQREFENLRYFSNCYFHGAFMNPDDLPEIYANIDMVLSTYDVEYENVRYAEPNKIYEAIYFETPIIVSSGTFLSEKVSRLNIGYSVDPMDECSVVKLIESIDVDSLKEKMLACAAIDKELCLNVNDRFFERLKSLF